MPLFSSDLQFKTEQSNRTSGSSVLVCVERKQPMIRYICICVCFIVPFELRV